jgi:hypothetical protein
LVIASRTLFAIVPPLLFCAILALLLSDREPRSHGDCETLKAKAALASKEESPNG